MLDAKLGLSIGRCTTFYQCGRLSAHLERGNGTSNIINVQDGRFPPWGTADTLEEAMAALKAYWESADVPIKWPPPAMQIGLQIPRPDHPEWRLRQSSKMAIEKSFYPSELTARR